MTRKDYVLIAEALGAQLDRESIQDNAPGVLAVERAAKRVADKLAKENPRFDVDRFMRAVSGA